ncbi:MAG TPA: hypothetical protein VL400_17425 [Polyangiaceae bacterium]|nr:hypothetical protein [Polyangiaceae bacterium]
MTRPRPAPLGLALACPAVVAVCAVACDDGGADAAGSCGPVADVAVVEVEDLDEASGLAASAIHEAVLYAHNDAGDSARFFAFSVEGEALGSWDLAGAEAVDWEDMARGPCDSTGEGSCLYLGDIGDNDRSRSQYAVFRVEEPASLDAGSHTALHTRFAFSYPDGPHDAEALVVDPATGQVTIITKEDPPVAYALPTPMTNTETMTAKLVGSLATAADDALITGADLRAGVLVVRTGNAIWSYEVAGSFAQSITGTPTKLGTPDEAQGESVAWSSDGRALYTLSEGERPVLHRTACDL